MKNLVIMWFGNFVSSIVFRGLSLSDVIELSCYGINIFIFIAIYICHRLGLRLYGINNALIKAFRSKLQHLMGLYPNSKLVLL